MYRLKISTYIYVLTSFYLFTNVFVLT